jgi:DNA-binding NarL/FixJ family response regulator
VEAVIDALGYSHPLSKRERAVLILEVKGYSAREIAESLSIEPSSVRSFRKRIVAKLVDFDRVSAAVAYARRQLLDRP